MGDLAGRHPWSSMQGIQRHSDLAKALRAVPSNRDSLWVIQLLDGEYSGQFVVDQPRLCLVGQGRRTVITGNAHAGRPIPGGGLLGTRGSATLTIKAADVQLHGLTVENTFDYLRNDARSLDDPARTDHAQAVALALVSGADLVRASDLRVRGHQDTLLADAGRAHFDRCEISGSVDFIFGAGQCLISESDIISLPRANRELRPQGFVAAPSTSIQQPYGLVFNGCRFKSESDVPRQSVALGRPWRPTRTWQDGVYGDPDAVGHCAVLNCALDAHIVDYGWAAMPWRAQGRTDRAMLHPLEARLFEFGNTGPGAGTHASRRQLSRIDAEDLLQVVRYETARRRV